MVPRFSRSQQHGWGIAPPIFFFLKKKTGRARSKRKTLFVQTCPSGQVWGCGRLIASFPQICPAPSECAATRLATHAYAASCDASSNSEGACQCVPLLFPLPLPGMDSKGRGRSPRFVSFEGEVQEGETEIPLLACLLDRARPVFSTGRKWGVHYLLLSQQNLSVFQINREYLDFRFLYCD